MLAETMYPFVDTTTKLKSHTILIVDDDPDVRNLIELYLQQEGYCTIQANCGDQALQKMQSEMPDLVLLDLLMPHTDGFSVTKELKGDQALCNIPIIIITALDDRDSKLEGLRAGADDYLHKPIDGIELCVKVRNLLRIKDYQDRLEQDKQRLELRVSESTQIIRKHFVDTILTLMKAAEYRDEQTGLHVRRISHYCLTLAQQLGADKQYCDEIFYASPMHDIGKIGIPDRILLKSSSFSLTEWETMKTHTLLGKKILEDNETPYLAMAVQIAYAHHEQWDGGGYPLGSVGKQIPLCARIMSVCDVYDALRSRRPYKNAMRHEDAEATMLQGDGRTQPSHFDPELLAAFGKTSGTFANIYAEMSSDV